MSYDVCLIGRNGRSLAGLDENYTYNVFAMFEAAGEGSPTKWNGQRAADVAEACERILTAFEADPERFIAMNPPNGWGDFGGAARFIRRIREACLLKPNATVSVT